tara:strand:- start:972 stop:1226 length:255 start_codon:yes stop_codon:yes gene_type:complete
MEIMNETENYVYSALTKEYGDNWDAMDKDIVLEKRQACNKFYNSRVIKFRENQSASNYNMLITAMISLQFWNQRKIKEPIMETL